MNNAPLCMGKRTPAARGQRMAPAAGRPGFAGLGDIYRRKLPNLHGRNDVAGRGPLRQLFRSAVYSPALLSTAPSTALPTARRQGARPPSVRSGARPY